MYPTPKNIHEAMGFLEDESFPGRLVSPPHGVRAIPIIHRVRVKEITSSIDRPLRVAMFPEYGEGQIELEQVSFDIGEEQWGAQLAYGDRPVHWYPDEKMARSRVEAAPNAYKLVRRYISAIQEVTE